MSRATLLVVAHAADRAGSVKVLLELIGRIAATLEWPVAVQLQAGGPLADELLALGTPARPDDRPAAVWVNNAAAAGALWAHDPATPSLVHVHEEDEALAALTPAAADALRRLADVVVCVSERSVAGVVALGVHPDRVHLVPPPVVAPSATDAATEQARAELGAAGRRLVLGCGEATWRKGADLFVEVAAALAADPDLAFAWVGRRRPHPFGRALDHDTAAVGLTGRLRWAGEVAAPGPHLAAADVLVVCSREDPRPLAPLEAALVGTPTCAFDVGGLAVMAAAGAAATVPYPDVAGLAALTAEVLADGGRAAGLAARAVALARRDHDPDVIAGALRALLEGAPGDRPHRPGNPSR